MAKGPEEKKEVVPATPSPAALPANFGGDFAAEVYGAASGFEGTTAKDYAIPFLTVLQALSPQLNRQKGEFIKGAEQGEILNTVSAERWASEVGVVVIPCAYMFRVVEWVPREKGGGMVEQYTRESAPQDGVRNDKGKVVRPNGNLLSDTAYHYVLLFDPETGVFEQCVMSLSSTQLKKSRKWMSLMQNQKMEVPGKGLTAQPMYMNMYRCTTVPESNDSGSWYGWQIQHLGTVPNIQVFRAAKTFHEAVMEGLIEAKPPETMNEADDAHPM
jgi:hypothetical protein